MSHDHQHHWANDHTFRRIRMALVASFALHLAVVFTVMTVRQTSPKRILAVSFDMDLVQPGPVQDAEVKPEPPKPEPPEPEPPKPEPPKPEPEPKPEPKPCDPCDPKSSCYDPCDKTSDCYDPDLCEPKPEPKPEPPKPKPTPPKPQPKQETTKPAPEVTQMAKAAETGARVKDSLPPMLNAWARLVQRRVEPMWVVPGGMPASTESDEALISFTLNREGRFVVAPQIVDDGGNRQLAESGLRAVIAAEPLPPLPPEFAGDRQEVVYAFTLAR